MRIFVTGGAGYIGSACVEYLINNGHSITVFDSLVTGHKEAIDPRAKFIKGDLSNKELLFKTIKNEKFDAIMHFAAFSLVGESMENPSKYFTNNNVYGINLLNAAVVGNIRTFIFSSSASIYGLPEQPAVKEDSPQLPISPYGESKLIFEKMLSWYSKTYGMKYVALRYFNAAGATENYGEDHNPETHLIPLVMKVAIGKQKTLKVFGNDYKTPDGTCLRDYIHILDLAQAHMLALNAPNSGFYNLGTGSGFSVKEIIETARKIISHPIPTETTPRRPGDPAILIADSTLARKKLNWQPKFEDINKIISSAWLWTKKHPNGYQG